MKSFLYGVFNLNTRVRHASKHYWLSGLAILSFAIALFIPLTRFNFEPPPPQSIIQCPLNPSAVIVAPLNIHQVSYGKAKTLASILCQSKVLPAFFSHLNISWGRVPDIDYQRQLLNYDVIFSSVAQHSLFEQSHTVAATVNFPLFLITTTPTLELNKATLWNKRIGILGQTNITDSLIARAIARQFDLTMAQIAPITFDHTEAMNEALESGFVDVIVSHHQPHDYTGLHSTELDTTPLEQHILVNRRLSGTPQCQVLAKLLLPELTADKVSDDRYVDSIAEGCL